MAQTGGESARASLAAVAQANRLLGEEACVSRFAGTGDGRLHHVTAGAGPIVLFLHGFPSFWYCWIRQIAALRDRFTCVALDAPGAGASARPQPGDAYRVPALVSQLAEFITRLAGGRRIILVGHDWGASLAFALAQARPDLLAGVCGIAAPPYNQVLAAIATDPGQRARSRYMEGLRTMTMATATTAAPDMAAGAYAGPLARGDIDAAEHALFLAACGDPAALAGGAAWYSANLPAPGQPPRDLAWPAGDPPLAVPAQLIWGDADETFAPRAPADFTARHPGAQVIHLPEVNHWCMLQAAPAVNQHLGTFATRLLADQPEAMAR